MAPHLGIEPSRTPADTTTATLVGADSSSLDVAAGDRAERVAAATTSARCCHRRRRRRWTGAKTGRARVGGLAGDGGEDGRVVLVERHDGDGDEPELSADDLLASASVFLLLQGAGVCLVCLPGHFASHLLPVAGAEKLVPLPIVAPLHVPEALVARRPRLVEVLVGVVGIQPGATEVAEVRIALVASHVVAAHGLGCGRVAVGARRGVGRDVVVGGLFFGRELGGVARVAALVGAVPGLVADAAEGEAAFGVLAYCEAVVGVVGGVRALGLGVLGVGVGVGVVGEVGGDRRVLGAARWVLAVVARAVDGVLVGFKTLFALHLDVAAGCWLADAHGEELAGVQSLFLRSVSDASEGFAAGRVKALYCGDVALLDGAVVEVLKALLAEDVLAAVQFVAGDALLGLQADAAIEGPFVERRQRDALVKLNELTFKGGGQGETAFGSLIKVEGLVDGLLQKVDVVEQSLASTDLLPKCRKFLLEFVDLC